MKKILNFPNKIFILSFFSISFFVCAISAQPQLPQGNRPMVMPINHRAIKEYLSLYPGIKPVLNYDELRRINIPNTTIVSVEEDQSGNFCMVTSIFNLPPSSNQITIWTALPLNNWNGRFMGTGGGGFSGGNSRTTLDPATKGFAAGATNAGHNQNNGSFGFDATNHRLNWQSIQDFAYNGIHAMTVVSKALVEAFYGKPAMYSYFVGESTGGRQGLMAAQRFPDDYNGIYSGCPAINWERFIPGELWPQIVMHQENNYVSSEKLNAVTQYVIEVSDGLDGIVDGVIDNPFICKWDPSMFVGTMVNGSEFTEKDALVVRKIWEGPYSVNGTQLWYGLTKGTNLAGLAGTRGSPLTGSPFPIALDWFRYYLTFNPNLTVADLNYIDYELLFNQSTQMYVDVIGTSNPDLTSFKKHGGKIIITHGLADNLIAPQGTIHYYEQLQRFMGGYDNTKDFARLFLFPGLDHGFRGNAPIPTNVIDAIIQWVEQGKAPDSFLGELHDTLGNVVRTRPIFAYPYTARYTGTGSINDASNYRSTLEDADSYLQILIGK